MCKKVMSGIKEKAEFMLWRELEDEYEVYVNDLVTVQLTNLNLMRWFLGFTT
jgi:hypothetical protein